MAVSAFLPNSSFRPSVASRNRWHRACCRTRWRMETTAAPADDRSSKIWRSVVTIAAATERGALATPYQRQQVDNFIDELVSLKDAEGVQNDVVTGRFKLVYGSTPDTFRSSIFFWGLKQSVAGSKAWEDGLTAVFRVTGSFLGVRVWSAVQEIGKTEIRSVVDMDIWPGFRGDVVSAARLPNPLIYDGGLDEQMLELETTRVERSNYLPVPSVWAVPVGRALDRIAQRSRSFSEKGRRAKFRIVYGDENWHVVRVGDGSYGPEDTFIYEKQT